MATTIQRMFQEVQAAFTSVRKEIRAIRRVDRRKYPYEHPLTDCPTAIDCLEQLAKRGISNVRRIRRAYRESHKGEFHRHGLGRLDDYDRYILGVVKTEPVPNRLYYKIQRAHIALRAMYQFLVDMERSLSQL